MYWIDWAKALKNFTKPALLFGLSYMNSVYSDHHFNITEAKYEFERLMSLNNFTTLIEFYEAIAKPFPYDEQQKTSVGLDRLELDDKLDWGTVLCYVTTGKNIVSILDHFESSRHSDYPNRKSKIYITIKDQHYSKHLSNFLTLTEYNFYIIDRLSQTSNYRLNSLKSEKNLSEITLPLLVFPDGYSSDAVVVRCEHEYYQIKLTVNVNRWKADVWHCTENEKFVKSAEVVYINRCQAKYRPRQNCKCLDLYSAGLSGDENYMENKRILCRNKIYFENFDREKHDYEAQQFFFNTTRETCPKNETLMKLREICISSLLYPCEIWSYQYTHSFDWLQASKDEFSKDVTTVEISYPGYYDVSMLIESESQTWEDFVGNVGGILGVWTGASILSIVQLVYLFCFKNDAKT